MSERSYKCLLCGVDHPIVDGRVEHTIFRERDLAQNNALETSAEIAQLRQDAARYRALHPYLRGCFEYDSRGHVLRLGERTIPTGEKESGWTGELIDRAADYAVAVKNGTLPDFAQH